MSEPDNIVIHQTIDESSGMLQPSDPKDDQASDSKSNPVHSTDQQQSHLRMQLLTMARHAHSETVGELDTLRDLIERYKSEVNAKDEDTGKTPIHVAAQNGLVGAVEQLLRAGAELETQDRAGFTPLMTATECQKVDVMKKLLEPRPEFGGDMKSQLQICGSSGLTPLSWACLFNFPEDVDLRDSEGLTALHSAVIEESVEMVNIRLCTLQPNKAVKA
ncbi:hypothetical protein COL5a_001892 [Colletotrichum fioriniae]|nr:uncharacterized protein COL516b_001281 [Colletotrichum fioriniae]KAJ0312209.1 hypothetical protein COL516b_001281 [Colletotrichum fioriniae]KAJ0332188.1 hypothetical protein COL5a_001892 [Colletotrichum fioriniae]